MPEDEVAAAAARFLRFDAVSGWLQARGTRALLVIILLVRRHHIEPEAAAAPAPAV